MSAIIKQFTGAPSGGDILTARDDRLNPIGIIFFIHGHDSSPWSCLERFALPLVSAGYLVVLPTLFGYMKNPDQSSDYGGPKTVKALHSDIDWALNNCNLPRIPLGIYGVSRGAMAASLLVAKYPKIFKAGALQAGIYDFDIFAEETLEGIKRNIRNEASDNDYQVRSVVNIASSIEIPLLILHGENDKNVPVKQALEFSKKLNELKKEYELVIFEKLDHFISGPSLKKIIPFFNKYLV